MNRKTTSDVLIPEWKRLLGYIIDVFLIGAMVMEIVSNRSYHNDSLGAHVAIREGPLWFLLFSTLYYLLLEGLSGRTLGKLLTGTIVVNSISYKKATFDKILIKTFSRLIPFDAFSFLMSYPKGWHDALSCTTVINDTNTPLAVLNQRMRRLLILGVSLPIVFAAVHIYQNGAPCYTLLSSILSYFVLLFIGLKFNATTIFNKWIRLSLSILSFLFSFLGPYFVLLFRSLKYDGLGGEDKTTPLFFVSIGFSLYYWIFIFIIAWVYQGFKNGQHSNNRKEK